MAKFINADAFKEHLKQFAEARFGEDLHGFMLACFVTQIMKKIDDFPAADVKEVQRGVWIEEKYGYAECSVCRADTNCEDKEGFPIGTKGPGQKWASWCPHCGAEMQEGKSEGNEKSE